MNNHINIVRIKAVHNALGELAGAFIFIGGATVSLYADRPAGDIRPTDDVDILIELMEYTGYAALDEQLRSKGFINDSESGVICRYTVHGITVDVMPTAKEILGFTNRWYAAAAAHSIEKEVEQGTVIRLFTAAYFLATKLEAFKSRGQRDGRTSTDFEDIVYLLNNRNSLWQELAGAAPDLHHYLRQEFSALLDNPYLDEWISVHLEYSEQRRINYIMGHMAEFIERL